MPATFHQITVNVHIITAEDEGNGAGRVRLGVRQCQRRSCITSHLQLACNPHPTSRQTPPCATVRMEEIKQPRTICTRRDGRAASQCPRPGPASCFPATITHTTTHPHPDHEGGGGRALAGAALVEQHNLVVRRVEVAATCCASEWQMHARTGGRRAQCRRQGRRGCK